MGFLAKKVLTKINVAIFLLRDMRVFQCCYLKHCTRSFCIYPGDNGRMQVYEASLVKELVNSIADSVANPKDSSESIGTEAQMRYFS
mmetsp:Transcript_9887/g.22836  ORF Transcript_9887/g.22836 Transcript_9887/m.22836 type:complete len:87 (-) Transcript_9887:5439-5699(-)